VQKEEERSRRRGSLSSSYAKGYMTNMLHIIGFEPKQNFSRSFVEEKKIHGLSTEAARRRLISHGPEKFGRDVEMWIATSLHDIVRSSLASSCDSRIKFRISKCRVQQKKLRNLGRVTAPTG
jgi:hypothetical protein